MKKCKKCVFKSDCNFIVKYADEDKYACICTKYKSKEDNEKDKKLNDLLYVIRTNMTSITRYVRHERKDHPTLTEGQFIDQHLKYKELANVAVSNILEYINGSQKRGDK